MRLSQHWTDWKGAFGGLNEFGAAPAKCEGERTPYDPPGHAQYLHSQLARPTYLADYPL